jgi:transposase
VAPASPGAAHTLQAAGEIDWSRVIIDASYVQAKKGGSGLGPSPVDRGRSGVKHHVVVDGHGLPLAWSATPANRNDVTQLLPLIDAIPHVPGRIGRPRHRPARLIADLGYDHDLYRRQLWQRGIKPLIARRRTEHGSGLGHERWTVERTISHLHNKRRLLVRADRSHETHEALLGLAACLLWLPPISQFILLERLRNTGPGESQVARPSRGVLIDRQRPG